MSDYTPTTDEVRCHFAQCRGCYRCESDDYGDERPSHKAEFDRWLESIKDEFYKEGFKHGVLMERSMHGQPLNGLIRKAQAKAWDEGREVGHLDRSVWAGHAPEPKSNPYREAVTE